MNESSFSIVAQVVDVLGRRVYPAKVTVADGTISRIEETSDEADTYILPGFVDSHVHIESSMLVPSEFARKAVVHGTVATVSDPHEIGNVLGVEGVHYMLDNAAHVPFKFCFGAPSCVPATAFETAGAEISVDDVQRLLNDPRIGYLSEMMNFPGVLSGDPVVTAKIEAAKQRGKPIDGHAPGLRGDEAKTYIAAGITTDHECFTMEEALDKIACGAMIAIREGSAARNFAALHPLIDVYPDQCMLCSDDKHPDELMLGHIDVLVRRALDEGLDHWHVLQAACVNPVRHYGLNVGLLREGDPADFIEVNNLDELRVLRTYLDGQVVAEHGRTTIDRVEPTIVNQFNAEPREPGEFAVPATSDKIHVIEAIDGQLITLRQVAAAVVKNGCVVSDPVSDVLKLAVVNRYQPSPPAIAFIKNLGLRRGALASSVAHDSHNVIAVGVSDEDLCAAINLVIEARGGLAVADGQAKQVLSLPVAGLMSPNTCDEVGLAYGELDKLVKDLGSPLRAPFMTLSFMALLVIPEIKLSDRGLFDGTRFSFLPLFV